MAYIPNTFFNMYQSIFVMLFLCLLWACNDGAVQSGPAASVTTPAKERSYQEMHRPQFHFSPKEKWMNDPNGMVYYAGEYHLFYQYYPDSTVWGPMHWGHAVSTDLVHWEHLPIALYPDELGYIFSGSAVVDWKNTSGFGQGDQPPLIAIFTYHDPVGAEEERTDFQYQAIAYSNDSGRTWIKYEGNPVVPNVDKIRDFRDPKVIWDDDSGQWVMIFAADDHVKIYGSKDLKEWQHLSDWGKDYGVHDGVWECPDLFPMSIDGTGQKKWVLLQSLNPGGPHSGSATQYFIGNFDGKQFTLDNDFKSLVPLGSAVWLDYGRDNYAGVTWSDVPKEDGRRIFMGWMSNWDYAQVVPTETWRSAMTIARTLTLKNTESGIRLLTQPVKELEKLRGKLAQLAELTVEGTLDQTQLLAKPSQSEVVLEFAQADPTANFGVELSNGKGERYRVGYDATRNHFYSDRTKSGKTGFSEKFATPMSTAPRLSKSNTIKMHLFFDVASAELFADDGTVVITEIFFPTEDFNRLSIYSEEGKVQLIKGDFYELKSIW